MGQTQKQIDAQALYEGVAIAEGQHRDPDWGYRYARHLGHRFPEAEPYIIQSPQVAVAYAEALLGEPWPEAEASIARDAQASYTYAWRLLQGSRFPAGEPAIAQDPDFAYRYAKDIIRGRWPEGEDAILTDPMAISSYSARVLERRWPEAEEVLLALMEEYSTLHYDEIKRILGINHPLHEVPNAAFQYARDVIRARWLPLEKYILTTEGREWQYQYARDILARDWPEAGVILNPWDQ
jgi:hypothetical protein